MKIPDIRKYNSVQTFFADFIKINQPEISHRKFAGALDWPTSLLGDLIAGRRRLSIARAAEFGSHFKMTGLEMERLIFLAMRENENTPLQDFVESYFRTDSRELIYRSEAPPDLDLHEVSAELMGDYPAMAVHALLCWSRGQITEVEIMTHLGALGALSTLDGVRKALTTLRDARVISGNEPHFVVEKAYLICSEYHRKHQAGSLEFLKAISDSPDNRGYWVQGTLSFPKSKYTEFIQRLVSLRTWIFATCVDAEKDPQCDLKKECLPLQLHLCISHLADLSALGLALKPDDVHEQVIVESVASSSQVEN